MRDDTDKHGSGAPEAGDAGALVTTLRRAKARGAFVMRCEACGGKGYRPLPYRCVCCNGRTVRALCDPCEFGDCPNGKDHQ